MRNYCYEQFCSFAFVCCFYIYYTFNLYSSAHEDIVKLVLSEYNLLFHILKPIVSAMKSEHSDQVVTLLLVTQDEVVLVSATITGSKDPPP